MKKTYLYLLGGTLLLLWAACARVGSPTGGEQDKTPPKVVKTIPPNESVNFTGNRIRIYFDEFVTLRDIRKQLIISPPLAYFPEITPSGNASKYINIKILDTLRPNTTYTFNFGKSIQDNNEGNPLSFYTYTFSTGNTIDSLTLKGSIKDALRPKAENFVNVMLYEIGEKYSDSVVYKQRPIYVVNTLDSLTTFELSHLKAGKYMLVGMKDKDNNYLFDPKTDKIGFHPTPITIPTDSSYTLSLFKEVPQTQASRPFQSGEQRISIGYQGEKDSIQVTPLPPFPANWKWVIEKEPTKDTLWLWYHPKVEDSLKLIVKSNRADTTKVNLRKMKPEKWKITPEFKGISPTEEEIVLSSNTPIRAFNKEAIKLIVAKDSTEVGFEPIFTANTSQITLKVKVKEGEKYLFKAFNAFENFFGQKSDTLQESFSAKKAEDFGSLKLTFKDNVSLPFIIELTDKDAKKVLYEQYVEQTSPTYNFPFVKAGNYRLRVIEDRNRNKKWDTGNFLGRLLPEPVRYFAKEIELRANWEVEQEISFVEQTEEKPKPTKEKANKTEEKSVKK
ncbi:Ig-like domain-containing protein [Capnocytophaga gingivalis]|uniref:Ig-like domain-containing protein n=1 Tax=Capnocytophaga gingivalis TaxID=1017 RepID=A0ABU5Z5F1_9FLAO|nr:Ig-like domain-containing protein [Capnocytophaga gingivalis]MEB3074177.1 Ig-like domain-containing protein [Capnocytophaga gingivalis]